MLTVGYWLAKSSLTIMDVELNPSDTPDPFTTRLHHKGAQEIFHSNEPWLLDKGRLIAMNG